MPQTTAGVPHVKPPWPIHGNGYVPFFDTPISRGRGQHLTRRGEQAVWSNQAPTVAASGTLV